LFSAWLLLGYSGGLDPFDDFYRKPFSYGLSLVHRNDNDFRSIRENGVTCALLPYLPVTEFFCQSRKIMVRQVAVSAHKEFVSADKVVNICI
jgi:hypothetical protein